MSEPKESNWSKPYVKRRVVYAVAILAVAIGTGLGLSDAAASQIEGYIPVLLAALGGIGGPAYAAAHTHRGSDSTATGADVRAAQAAAVDLNAVAEAVRERVAPEVTRAAAEVEKRISSYGKHAAAAKPPVGATYPGSEDA